MQLQQKMVGDSLVNMTLKKKQQYTTKRYIHLEQHLHISIHGQILLNNRKQYLEKTNSIRRNSTTEESPCKKLKKLRKP